MTKGATMIANKKRNAKPATEVFFPKIQSRKCKRST